MKKKNLVKKKICPMILCLLLVLPFSVSFSETGFHFTPDHKILSFTENAFRFTVSAPGTYTITVHDETTVYRVLTGEITETGEQLVFWDGTGFNQERLDKRVYQFDAEYVRNDGVTETDHFQYTIEYSGQAVNYALPSSSVLNLKATDDWFMEVKAVMDGTLMIELIPEDKGQNALVFQRAVNGGKLHQFSWKAIAGTTLPPTGNYKVKVFDPKNSSFGREFPLHVTDEPVEKEEIRITGEIMPREGDDPETIWQYMMMPSTVVDIGFHQHQKVYENPDKKSKTLGTVHGQTQALKVMELSSGKDWAKVGAWNHETADYIEGWVPTKVLKVVYPEKDYGLLFDKQRQTLTVFYQGTVFDSLLVSTGKMEKNKLYQETSAGSFLTGTHRGSFSSNGKKFDYVIQYDGGNLIHQIPYYWNNSRKDFSAGDTALGAKASHGCIRVQAKPTEKEGINAYWLWTHIPYGTRVIVLDDLEQRQEAVQSLGY